MTKNQAYRLKKDIEENLTDADFSCNLYVSIKNIGTKIFRQCAYHEAEGWFFIWSKDDTFIVNQKDVGDVVIVSLQENVCL